LAKRRRKEIKKEAWRFRLGRKRMGNDFGLMEKSAQEKKNEEENKIKGFGFWRIQKKRLQKVTRVLACRKNERKD